MAIEKTVFTSGTAAGRAAEVLTFMQSAAADYFDTISADTDGNVCCYIGQDCALKLGMDGVAKYVTINLKNGSTAADASTSNALRFAYGIKTGNGAFVKIADNPVKYVIITKTNDDSLALIANLQVNSGLNLIAGDYEHGTNIISAAIADTSGVYKQVHRSLTVLAPLCLDETYPSYAPKAFFMQSYQYRTEAILTLGGKQYVSTGVFALEG
jgi:hypothetical protein